MDVVKECGGATKGAAGYVVIDLVIDFKDKCGVEDKDAGAVVLLGASLDAIANAEAIKRNA